MDSKHEIAGAVQTALAKLLSSSSDGGAPSPEAPTAEAIVAALEVPKDSAHGDFAFPCFQLAKALRKAPPLIAKTLAESLAQSSGSIPGIQKITPLGPYVNFFLNKAALGAQLIPAILSGQFLARRPDKSQRVMVEYSQPNTHKAFHVGHLRNASLGDSLARILEWNGHPIVRSNYIGDEGTHVAKCLWLYLKHPPASIPEYDRGELLGDYYVKGVIASDLASLTRVPVPGVQAARVLAISAHPQEKAWQVVDLETTQAHPRVVCAASGFVIGDMVAYAPPGCTVGDKEVGTLEKKGTISEGMICSEAELGLSEDNNQAAVLPKDSAVGALLMDLYRIPEAVPAGKSVLQVYQTNLQEISEVLRQIESKQGSVYELWQRTRQWSIDDLWAAYNWLDAKFDKFFFESEMGELSKQMVRSFLEKGVFVESDGAIGADLRDYKLGFCILIKRDGTATYACRDLALAQMKFDQYKIDWSIYVVDSAQTLHFKQVFKCLELMGYAQVRNCYHLPYEQVVLTSGKMSSRKGNVILFSQLKNLLTSTIDQEFLSKYRGEWPEEELATAAQRIAIATMRYGMLNQDNNSQIVFDLQAWTAKTGNTGPYMLYAYARICSILRQLSSAGISVDYSNVDYALLTHESEEALLTYIGSYHNVLERAVQKYSPLEICSFSYELAKRFSRMFQNCSVLHAGEPRLQNTRAALADACGRVLKHALSLLGIQTIERM
jgi:arginyl-tRNA synthetase